MFDEFRQYEFHVLICFCAVVKYNNRTWSRSFDGTIQTNFRIQRPVVVEGKYIPHHDPIVSCFSYLRARYTSKWWTEQFIICNAMRSQLLFTHMYVFEILLIAGAPSVEVIECVISNGVTRVDNLLKLPRVFAYVVADAKECRFCVELLQCVQDKLCLIGNGTIVEREENFFITCSLRPLHRRWIQPWKKGWSPEKSHSKDSRRAGLTK